MCPTAVTLTTSVASLLPSNFAAVGTFKTRCLNFLRKSTFMQMHTENGHFGTARGSLIVLEGLDCCGKTSQCGKLVSYLHGQGFPVEAWRFPDRSTYVGDMISSYLANELQLDDRAIHLLFSANRWEKRSLMEAKLRSGVSLIVDRYSYSGVAFSAAKGLDTEWCKAPEKGLIAPDLVVYLHIPPEVAAKRGGYGNEIYEHLDFQRKVAQQYHILRDRTWKVIDASLSMETVETKLRELAVKSVAACRKGEPLSNLWPNNESEVK